MNAVRSSKLSLKSIYSRFVAAAARSRGKGGVGAASAASQVRLSKLEEPAPRPGREGSSGRAIICSLVGKLSSRCKGVRPRGIRPLIASFLFLASPLLTTPGATLFPVTRASLYPIPFYTPSRSPPAEREPRYFSKRCFTTYAP
jgi:hypothetical protein